MRFLNIGKSSWECKLWELQRRMKLLAVRSTKCKQDNTKFDIHVVFRLKSQASHRHRKRDKFIHIHIHTVRMNLLCSLYVNSLSWWVMYLLWNIARFYRYLPTQNIYTSFFYVFDKISEEYPRAIFLLKNLVEVWKLLKDELPMDLVKNKIARLWWMYIRIICKAKTSKISFIKFKIFFILSHRNNC